MCQHSGDWRGPCCFNLLWWTKRYSVVLGGGGRATDKGRDYPEPTSPLIYPLQSTVLLCENVWILPFTVRRDNANVCPCSPPDGRTGSPIPLVIPTQGMGEKYARSSREYKLQASIIGGSYTQESKWRLLTQSCHIHFSFWQKAEKNTLLPFAYAVNIKLVFPLLFSPSWICPSHTNKQLVFHVKHWHSFSAGKMHCHK